MKTPMRVSLHALATEAFERIAIRKTIDCDRLTRIGIDNIPFKTTTAHKGAIEGRWPPYGGIGKNNRLEVRTAIKALISYIIN